MAIFHLNAKIISRGKGQSAIAAAAYRSGERLRDEQAGEQKFYEARAERIVFTDIMAPKDAPEWAHDRNQLWNEVERFEKRKDAQLAREIEVSLPHELDAQQREWLVKDFAREAFVRQGYVVDIAIHAPDRDSDERNHHAHLMVTMRTLGEDGFAATKDRSLNSPEQLSAWREQWANLANRHLERHGHEARIDHRSLEAQGAEREPTTHLGYAANEMTARGAQSDRADDLRDILERNEIRVQLKGLDAMIAAVEDELTASQQAEQKNAIWERLAAAAKADELKRRNPGEQAFGESARQAAQDIRAERQEAALGQRQEAWRADVVAHQPGDAQPRGETGGLHVVDGVTGVVSKLGDFMVDFLAGSSAPQPEQKPTDMRAFVTDPEARKQQQLARLAARQATENDREALESMRRDMQAGKNLRSSDIAHLTQEHQLQIYNFGDSAVRQMVDDLRKRDEENSKGYGRERDW